MSQADEYRNCNPIVYPGFNSEGPHPPPFQNGKPVSITAALDSAVTCNMEVLGKRGVGREFHKLMTTEPRLKDFLRDAFWWFFLEYFVSVDFDALLNNVKSNTLVSENDMAAFAFEGAVPMLSSPASFAASDFALSNYLPEIKPNLVDKTGALNKQQQESVDAEVALGLRIPMPPHLCGLHCDNRRAEAIAQVGSPRILSAAALAQSIHSCSQPLTTTGSNNKSTTAAGLTGTKPRATQVTPRQLHASPHKDRERGNSPSDSDDDRSSTSSCASSVASALSVSRFPSTSYSLHNLPVHARLQVAAKEQHQLFTRMAQNYRGLMMTLLPYNQSTKDGVSRFLPEILAQAVFYLYSRSMPFASKLLGPDFQLGIGRHLSFWIGGVQRDYNVIGWPIHTFLDPTVKKKRRASRHSISHRRKSSHAVTSQTIMNKLAEQISKIGAGSTRGGFEDAAFGAQRRVSLQRSGAGKHFQPTPPTVPSTATLSFSMDGSVNISASMSMMRPAPPVLQDPIDGTPHSRPGTAENTATTSTALLAGTSSASGTNHPTPPQQDPAEARKAMLVQQDIDTMHGELMKMRTTHTFSQYHYTGGITRQATAHANASGDDALNLPKRIAQAYVATSGKRNIQVIKKEIDERFREQLPWYCKQDARVTKRDGCSRSTTFSLSNWSPLMHRNMLACGEDNKAVPVSMFWTVVMPR
jgi:hypothetical protein